MGIKDLGIRIKRIRKHLDKSVVQFSTEMDLTSSDLEEIEKRKKKTNTGILKKNYQTTLN